jgi:hypothetical protein
MGDKTLVVLAMNGIQLRHLVTEEMTGSAPADLRSLDVLPDDEAERCWATRVVFSRS